MKFVLSNTFQYAARTMSSCPQMTNGDQVLPQMTDILDSLSSSIKLCRELID